MIKLLVILFIIIIFLQETHSSEEIFNEWRDNFKGEVFFRMIQQVLAV